MRCRNLARHMKTHLPPYVVPYNCCWECKLYIPQLTRIENHRKVYGCGQNWSFSEEKVGLWVFLMNGLLRSMCILRKKPGLSALCSFVMSAPELHADPNLHLAEDDTELMRTFERVNGYAVNKNRPYLVL